MRHIWIYLNALKVSINRLNIDYHSEVWGQWDFIVCKKLIVILIKDALN